MNPESTSPSKFSAGTVTLLKNSGLQFFTNGSAEAMGAKRKSMRPVEVSVIEARPIEWWLRPVRMQPRDGEHNAVVCMLV